MNRSLDLLAGRVLAKLGDVTLWNWSTYHALFLPPLRGERRHRISRQRARAAFWNAAATVPAYGSFLREHGTQHPRRWEDVPVMDKENYIKRHPLPALCQHGKLPLRGAVIDESSGTSGIATNWVRGHHERDATRRLLQYTALATFGDEGFVMLNAFALGPWATGMNVSMALVDRCLLKSTGPDQGKIVRTLEVLGPEYRYVICGYPPFMKTLVDTAGIDWSQYEVYAVVGGEGMSEGLRASLNRAFRKTYSSYGASDLAINLAVETDFSIALRQAIAADPTLGQALYGAGADTLPMVFQYDPLNQLIEADEQGSLLFTMNRLENVSPRIRYNLHDYGAVRTYEEVSALLKGRGVDLSHVGPPLPLPFLFHWGRREHAVAFYGCKVTPNDIQGALLRVPELGTCVADFALHPWEDSDANKRLDFWFMLREGHRSPENTGRAQDDFIAALAAVNQDFRESIRMVRPELRPALRFDPYGEGPLAGQDIRLKKRYVI